MASGEAGLVERVYREEAPALWRAILLFCGDRQIADDAVAEAFAQALRRGAEIHSLKKWVWRTAFNVAKGMLKDRARTAGSVPDAGYELPPSGAELVQLLQPLSLMQRAVVLLHYYADYPIREVAALLGSSAAAVGVHLHRARTRLRVLLEERDD